MSRDRADGVKLMLSDRFIRDIVWELAEKIKGNFGAFARVTTKDSYGRSSGQARGDPELTREELESGDLMLTCSFSKAMLLIAKLPNNRCEAGRF
jgi:hypothetical protein